MVLTNEVIVKFRQGALDPGPWVLNRSRDAIEIDTRMMDRGWLFLNA